MHFFLILPLLTVVVAQQPTLRCNYWSLGYIYACDLAIHNPNGFNNFTEIEGIHLDGFTNEDIDLVYTIGLSTNVPRIICDTFPNVFRFHLYATGLTEIDDSTFGGCSRVTELYLEWNRISSISTNAFVNLVDISILSLESNLLTTLPANVFASQQNLTVLYMNGNRLKTLSRNSFGGLFNLRTLDLYGNVVNALDRAIIDEAVNLNTLSFSGNLCANNYFGYFQINRAQYLPMLERCFINFRYIVDTITEGDDEYSFFEGPHPGIALRVNTKNEVQIALTPFSFIWSPMIEILIGTANNTRSVIRVNQDTNVATVPTPNIITRDQWNDFRITWANQVILVYSRNDTFPFMSFTMQDFFPVNFYGLRAVETRASWSVQLF